MSEQAQMAAAKAAINDARRTVERDTVLGADFKRTADEGLARILAGLDGGSMTVERAMELGKSLMEAVLGRRRHAEFQRKSRDVRSGEVAAA